MKLNDVMQMKRKLIPTHVAQILTEKPLPAPPLSTLWYNMVLYHTHPPQSLVFGFGVVEPLFKYYLTEQVETLKEKSFLLKRYADAADNPTSGGAASQSCFSITNKSSSAHAKSWRLCLHIHFYLALSQFL